MVDRTAEFRDRAVDYLKIETTLDRQAWQTTFEQTTLTAWPGYSPTKTMTIDVAPVEARFLRVTVDPKDPGAGTLACIDEFEVYAPAKQPPASLPRIGFDDARPEIWRPVHRTTLQVTTTPLRIEGDRELLELRVKNTGSMTALFCEPHPLIVYRTDLFIENNNCFIPPGESRVIAIRAARPAPAGLTLAQTSWRLSCWNADDVVVEPGCDVLLALGRRDAMCREFAGYFDPGKIAGAVRVTVEGTRPDPTRVPWLLDNQKRVHCEFVLNDAQAQRPARLRIHAADQAEQGPTTVVVKLNGRRMESLLPAGFGIQQTDPAHLAFPATAEFQIPTRDLRTAKYTLEVAVQGNGWFSWDAMDLTSVMKGERHAP